jgi:hypothetical protein
MISRTGNSRRAVVSVLSARITSIPQTLVRFCGNAATTPVGFTRIPAALRSTLACVPASSPSRRTVSP